MCILSRDIFLPECGAVEGAAFEAEWQRGPGLCFCLGFPPNSYPALTIHAILSIILYYYFCLSDEETEAQGS